jgi:hypothetical protein
VTRGCYDFNVTFQDLGLDIYRKAFLRERKAQTSAVRHFMGVKLKS